MSFYLIDKKLAFSTSLASSFNYCIAQNGIVIRVYKKVKRILDGLYRALNKNL